MNVEKRLNPPTPTDQEAGASGRSGGLVDLLGAASHHVALLAAWIAMCGSLFFSEVLGWPPCLLCWYQRILMYPLTLLIAIGILRRDHGLHLYVLPFSALGACVSLYHYLLIKTDWFPPPPCNVGIPCTVDYLNVFGFINIPFLALTAFAIITAMMAWSAQVEPQAVYDEARSDDSGTGEGVSGLLDRSRAAVVVIIAAVVLLFVLGSTLI